MRPSQFGHVPGLRLAICWLSVPRVETALARGTGTDRRGPLALLTPAEAALCLSRARPAEGIAARLAAKTALLRLLREREREAGGSAQAGDGPRQLFPAIQLTRQQSGQPGLVLAEPLQRRLVAAGLGGTIHVSLTHDRHVAGALVAVAAVAGRSAPASPPPGAPLGFSDHIPGRSTGS